MQRMPGSKRLKECAEQTSVDYNDVLAASTLTEEQAEQWYVTMWYDGQDFLRIDLYNGAILKGTDFIMEDATEVCTGEGYESG